MPAAGKRLSAVEVSFAALYSHTAPRVYLAILGLSIAPALSSRQ